MALHNRLASRSQRFLGELLAAIKPKNAGAQIVRQSLSFQGLFSRYPMSLNGIDHCFTQGHYGQLCAVQMVIR